MSDHQRHQSQPSEPHEFPPATPANVRRAGRLFEVADMLVVHTYGYGSRWASEQELRDRVQEGQAAGNGVQLVTRADGQIVAAYWPAPFGYFANAPVPDAPVLMLCIEAGDFAHHPGHVLDILRAMITAAEAVQPPPARRQRPRLRSRQHST